MKSTDIKLEESNFYKLSKKEKEEIIRDSIRIDEKGFIKALIREEYKIENDETLVDKLYALYKQTDGKCFEKTSIYPIIKKYL